MTKPSNRRSLLSLKRWSLTYRPVELDGEIKAAQGGVQVIDGSDFDKRAKALLNDRRRRANAHA